VAVFAGATALVARLPGAALWIACCWVATEAVRARLPFGGFPWGRLAFGQTDGPLLAIAQIAGAPGVSLSVALVGSATAAVLVAPPGARCCYSGRCLLQPLHSARYPSLPQRSPPPLKRLP